MDVDVLSRFGPKPVFIDDEMLFKTVKEQMEQTNPPIGNQEDIKYSEVLTLDLYFRKIMKIQFLWQFTSLTKLFLDNNLIDKIEGLDRLVNLTWLSLSYNKIGKIEGLETLQELELLDLTCNRISVIENLDTLEKLTHLYIGKNCIEQLEQVRCLRKFKKLYALGLSGNPLSKEDDYKYFIAAFFPTLKILDFKTLDKTTINEAAANYHIDLEKIKDEEQEIQLAKEIEQHQQAEAKLHKDAFVEFLNGSYMFKSMLKEDSETEIFSSVPAMADLLQTFEQQMVELCTQLFQIGLDEHKRREEEVSTFFSGHAKTMSYFQEKNLQISALFEELHSEKKEELQQLSDPDLRRVEINRCNDKIDQHRDRLVGLNLDLMLVLEDIVQKFDVIISERIVYFVEAVEDIFAQCRDLEDKYYENMKTITATTLEKVAKRDMEVELPDNVKELFKSKSTVMDALDTSHDNHLKSINNQELQLIMRANLWKAALIKGIEDKDLDQHNERSTAICRNMNYLKEQLEKLQ